MSSSLVMPVRSFRLSKPHRLHVPMIGRWKTGNPSGRNGGTRIGTYLACSCDTPHHHAGYLSSNPLCLAFTSDAPSAGGRAWAERKYREHLTDTAPQVEVTEAQLEVLRYVHDEDRAVRTTTKTCIGHGVVGGNTSAALIRRGLLRNVFDGPITDPRFVGVEATAAGCAILAQYARWTARP